MSEELIEKLADVQHEIWAHWMRYMFRQGTVNPDGSWTMPAAKVERWGGQMRTPYSALTEQERESDREQADKVLAVLPQLAAATKSPSTGVWMHTEKYTELLAAIERYGADQWRRGAGNKDPQDFDEWRKLESI